MFHGGMHDTFVMYLSDCVVLVYKKELVEKFTGWKNEESCASEDLLLHDIDKPKSNNRDTDKDVPEISTASEMEVEEAPKKKSMK